jgi:hypothetical protein
MSDVEVHGPRPAGEAGTLKRQDQVVKEVGCFCALGAHFRAVGHVGVVPPPRPRAA